MQVLLSAGRFDFQPGFGESNPDRKLVDLNTEAERLREMEDPEDPRAMARTLKPSPRPP